eukprot:7387160-Prymnesium_polylepis.1
MQSTPAAQDVACSSTRRPTEWVTDAGQLLLFERLFFRIDTEAEGALHNDNATLFLSFAAPHLSPAERLAAVQLFSRAYAPRMAARRGSCPDSRGLCLLASQAADRTDHGCLSRLEFVSMCSRVLFDMSDDRLELAVLNYR